jgi:multiple sugar transport system substrate-binding protein
MTGENVVLPLDGWIADARYGLGGSELRFDGVSSEEMIGKFLAEGVLDGTQYALPFMRSTEACYVNKTYVEALGYTVPDVLTWDFIWEVSEAAMKKNADGTFAVNGQNVMIPFIYKSTDNMMIQMLRQKGAGYSDEEGNILLFNETTEELLYEVADHVKTRAFSTFGISSYPGNYFNKGQCIFAIDSTAGSTWIGGDAPLQDIDASQIRQFETVARMIPQFDTVHPKMISQGPSLCIFNKASEMEVLASWLFAQYLLTNEVQIPYARTEGYVPVTSKAQTSPEYLDYLSRRGEDNDAYYYVKLDVTRLLMENTDNTFVTPVFNGSAALRQAAGEMIESVAKAVRSGETVDDAYMKELRSKVTSLYRLDQIRRSNYRELPTLPPAAIVLLATLGATWLVLGVCLVAGVVKKQKNRNTP